MLATFYKLYFFVCRRISRTVVNGYDLYKDPALPDAVKSARKGKFEPGRRLLAESSTEYELRAARLRKLSEAAIPNISALSTLYKENPDDGDIALWLGATHIEHGWQVRGAQRAQHTARRKFEEFWIILGRAYEPLERATVLRPDDPVPWDRLQWHGLGAQRPRQELDDIWTELKRRDPTLYEGHASRVQVLCEKWQGSNQEVLEFAEAAATEAPTGSPIPALLVAAGIEVALEQKIAPATYFRNKMVRTRLTKAADTWYKNMDGNIRTDEAHHMFGAAFYLIGDQRRARRHLSRVSPKSIPRTLPWGRLSSAPGTLYWLAREEVGVTDKPVFEPGPLPAFRGKRLR